MQEYQYLFSYDTNSRYLERYLSENNHTKSVQSGTEDIEPT
jgi:hypothetical protein